MWKRYAAAAVAGVALVLGAAPALAEDNGESDGEEQAGGFFSAWDSRASLGFSGHEGDNRSQSLNARLRTRFRDDVRRIELEGRYLYGRADGIRDQNEGRFEGTHDWLLPDSPWFLFVRTQYDYNEFRGWEQRAGAFGGAGYAFVDHDDLELLGRAGAGANYEFRGGRKWTPEALFGASVARWNITENQTLTGSVTYYPNLEAFTSEFRLESAIEWTVDINTADGLSLTLGASNEYESHPVDAGRRNNLNYYATLNIDF